MRYHDEESAATVGCLTDAEAAAMTVAAIYADATLGLGVDKWTLVQSRLRVGLARAEDALDLHDAVEPELARLGDGLILTKDTAAELLHALAVPGVKDELDRRLALAILRVRALRPARKKGDSQ